MLQALYLSAEACSGTAYVQFAVAVSSVQSQSKCEFSDLKRFAVGRHAQLQLSALRVLQWPVLH
jgi:hypothetical protein